MAFTPMRHTTPAPENDFQAIKISLASPQQILRWSFGEVVKAETINYRSLRPEKDGLFCERIFGPTRDWECYCGKYKRMRDRQRREGLKCEHCGVEVTRSNVRRERMGHISLAAPVAHIWFSKGTPSRMGLMLEITPRNLERVLYFSSYIITKVDEEARENAIAELEAYRDQEWERLSELQMQSVSDGRAEEYLSELIEEIVRLQNELRLGEDEMPAAPEGSSIEQQIDTLFAYYRVLFEKNIQWKIDQASSIQVKTQLTDSSYQELKNRFAGVFEAGMGADAILELLQNIDLDELHADLVDQIRTTSGQRRVRAIKRLSVVEAFRTSGNKPEWMILTVLPVLPPELHPMVQLDGGRFATSDLNDLYRRVINRNNRLKHLLKLAAPDIIVRNERRMLQEAVDALIDNGRRGRAIMGRHNHKLKSLTDLLRGKQGRFRQNLLGKRVDYSGRSVIISGPQLKLHECGLPKQMALELFKPFVMNRLIAEGRAHNIKTAKRRAEEADAEVWDTLEKVVEGHPVLLNRAPTLHRLGIQAFYPKLIEGSAIQLHPLVCAAFNADFDGDQMAVHIPLSPGSINEAKQLMLSTKNMLAPRSGAPIVSPTLDMLLGLYYLTGPSESMRIRVPKDDLVEYASHYRSKLDSILEAIAENSSTALRQNLDEFEREHLNPLQKFAKYDVAEMSDVYYGVRRMSEDAAADLEADLSDRVDAVFDTLEDAELFAKVEGVGSAIEALPDRLASRVENLLRRKLADSADQVLEEVKPALQEIRSSVESLSTASDVSILLAKDSERGGEDTKTQLVRNDVDSFTSALSSTIDKLVENDANEWQRVVRSSFETATPQIQERIGTDNAKFTEIDSSMLVDIDADLKELRQRVDERLKTVDEIDPSGALVIESFAKSEANARLISEELSDSYDRALRAGFSAAMPEAQHDVLQRGVDDTLTNRADEISQIEWDQLASLGSSDMHLAAKSTGDEWRSKLGDFSAQIPDISIRFDELSQSTRRFVDRAGRSLRSAFEQWDKARSAEKPDGSGDSDEQTEASAPDLSVVISRVLTETAPSLSELQQRLHDANADFGSVVERMHDELTREIATEVKRRSDFVIGTVDRELSRILNEASNRLAQVVGDHVQSVDGKFDEVIAILADDLVQAVRSESVRHATQLDEFLTAEIDGAPRWDLVERTVYEKGHLFRSHEEAWHAFDVGKIKLGDKIWVRLDPGSEVWDIGENEAFKTYKIEETNRWIETTVGRIIFNSILPDSLGFRNYVMHEDEIESIVHQCFEQLGNEGTATVLDEMKRLGFEYAMQSGTTIAIKDAVTPPEKSDLLSEGRAQVRMLEQQYEDGLITEEEKYTATIDTWNTTSDRVTAAVQSHLQEYNGVFAMSDSGAKGNLAQIKQMAGMRGLMSNPRGRIIDSPIEASFSEGLSVHEFFTSTHGSRKALADTALKTAEAGYLTRRMADAAQDVIINADDCGTTVGMEITAENSRSLNLPFDERIFSRYPVNDVVHPETGEVLATADDLIGIVVAKSIVEAGIEAVEVRSPVSCKLERGVCAKCYGSMLADNRASIVGEAVGIVAAQSIGEPGTQLTMRNFHTGGIASDRDITTGLPRVQELFEARNPKLAAILSDISGTVKFREVEGQHIIAVESEDTIRHEEELKAGYKASVKVGDWIDAGAPIMKLSLRGRKDASTSDGTLSLPEEVVAQVSGTVADVSDKIAIEWTERDEREYLPQGHVEILVSEGSTIEPGTPLTEGQKNPHDILRITGIEAVQKYLVEEAQRVYRSQGVKVHDKHFEVIVRQMLRKVKIDSSGDSTLLINEIVDRSSYMHENEDLRSKGGEPATASPVLLGISKVSLMSQSFLAKASFQETERVLTEAALQGSVDHLNGLKENVIIGRMIPARLDRSRKGREILGIPEPGEVKEVGEAAQAWEDVLAAIASGSDTGYGVPTNYTTPIDLLNGDTPAQTGDIGFSDDQDSAGDDTDDVLRMADSLLGNSRLSKDSSVSFSDE